MTRVLVGCEFSGVVRRAFRRRGYDAWSCDLLPTEDGDEHHIQDDVLSVVGQGWDIGIFHPPCTYLTNAGVRHLHDHVASKNGKRAAFFGLARWLLMQQAADFFNALKRAPIRRMCLENPIPHCYARDRIGDYTQVIQPWMFGHGETKATCFWLINLPCLERTHRKADLFCKEEPKERIPRVHLMGPSPNRGKDRSRFFSGIAEAMAEQWMNQ